MSKRKIQHELAAITIVYVRCSCGWKFREENLKGKTDEDLAIDTHAQFNQHLADSISLGFGNDPP